MTKNKWFAYASDNSESKLNLLCFPYAGGSASLFVQWKKKIGNDISVYPVLYPFREARRSERMPDTIQELAQKFVDENEEFLKSKDFAIFAHCAGATIAYEVVVYLRLKYGIEPKFFIASGAEPPCYSLESFVGFDEANDEQFIKYLIDSHFVNADVIDNSGFINYYIPIIKEDFKSIFAYSETKSSKLNCQIISICGDEDSVIDKSRLKDWQNYSEKDVIYESFVGDHYYFTSKTEEMCNMIYNFNINIK